MLLPEARRECQAGPLRCWESAVLLQAVVFTACPAPTRARALSAQGHSGCSPKKFRKKSWRTDEWWETRIQSTAGERARPPGRAGGAQGLGKVSPHPGVCTTEKPETAEQGGRPAHQPARRRGKGMSLESTSGRHPAPADPVKATPRSALHLTSPPAQTPQTAVPGCPPQ